MDQDIIVVGNNPLTHLGQIANEFASQNVFTDYHQRIAQNTLRRQVGDLQLFSTYLAVAGVVISVDELMEKPDTWSGVTYGLVEGFVRYQIQKGYAIGSTNVRLATIKKYVSLAAKAGAITSTEYALIHLVEGYSHKEGRNVNQGRKVKRIGHKKATAVSISKDQARQLKSQPDTPQGRRDALLMCLLLDHGLRCGEVQGLTAQSITLDDGMLTFYREKVDLEQTHRLTPDTYKAARRYIQIDKPATQLLMGSRKGGALCGGMSERAITHRVCVLGEAIGLIGLSAHDCRHYWATSVSRGKTDIKTFQDAGGWSSPAMPLRYVESQEIANEGVQFG
jgi:integrase